MKKLTYLLLVMFAVVLMTTSCEEESVTPDEPTEDPIITLEEFEGLWNFVQAEYDGKTYTSCSDVDDDPDADSRLGLVKIGIELIPEQYEVDFNCYIYWDGICDDIPYENVNGHECTLNEKQNTFKFANSIVYKILEYNKSTETLKAELIDGTIEYNLIGVKYIWQK